MVMTTPSPFGGRDDHTDWATLERTAFRVREHCIRMAAKGGCFLGAALSCADLLAFLYHEQLRVDPRAPSNPDRDYFFLSKGHAVPALYGVLAERGFFDSERLDNHLSIQDVIYYHPNPRVPGVDFHSGSLGHALSVGIGVAIDQRLRGTDGRVYVLLGDGELNEGSIWEAALVAASQRLGNLVAIVDRNRLQANELTEHLVPLEPIADKFTAFGWNAEHIDGHSFPEMRRAFGAVLHDASRPSVIIAQTVRGQGLPSMEGQVSAWFASLTKDELERRLIELRENAITRRREGTPR